VLGWGSNALGEVGDGTTVRRLSPVAVPGLTGVVEIAEGRNHVLARTSTGAVYAWGDNSYGQIGDGSTTRRTAPVLVIASGATGVDAGAHHSVAMTSTGTVLTWGRGYRGQLGLGTLSNRLTPTPVPGPSSIVEIGDGRDQTFAITASGQVWAWGSNAAGQLGDGSTTNRTSPVLLGLTGIVAAQSGSSHTVFLPAGSQAPQPPVAAFTSSCTLLDCLFDATTSSDPDGQIVGYAWDFGDGALSGAATPTHSYAAAGSYLVTLTVTDDTGLTATATRTVTVDTAPPAQVQFVATAGANANLTTHRVTIPAQTQPGDGLVLVFTTANTTTPGAPSGSGWQSVTGVTGSDIRTQVWARPAVTGDAGRAVTITMPAQTKAALTVSVYRGTGPTVVGAAATAAETTSTTVHTAPAVTVAAPGSMLLHVWSDKSSATTTIAPPPDLTVRHQSSTAGSGRVTTTLADWPPTGGSAPAQPATATSASSKATMLSLVITPT
jgi:PKD repeat protein